MDSQEKGEGTPRIPTVDDLVDRVQNLSVKDGADEHSVAAPTKTATLGIILDLHYVEVAAKQNAMATTWSPDDLVQCIREYVSTEVGCPVQTSALFAMDAELAKHGSAKGKKHLHEALKKSNFQLITSPSKGRAPSRTSRGRGRGRGRYEKSSSSDSHAQQGATDVDIVTALFTLAGAFAPRPQVQHIVLVGGDSDFLPALRCVHTAQHTRFGLQLWVCAHERWSMSDAYRQAIAALPGARVMPLSAIFRGVTSLAGVVSVDFRRRELPPPTELASVIEKCFVDNANAKVVIHLSHHQHQLQSPRQRDTHESRNSHVFSTPSKPVGGASAESDDNRSSIKSDASRTSKHGGKAAREKRSARRKAARDAAAAAAADTAATATAVAIEGKRQHVVAEAVNDSIEHRRDGVMSLTTQYFNDVFDRLLQQFWRLEAAAATRLEQLWLHHTNVDDGIAPTLAALVEAGNGALRQIHLSNTRMTRVGIVAVCKAAQKVGYGGKSPKKQSRKPKAGGAASRSQRDGGDEGDEEGRNVEAAEGAHENTVVVSWKLYLNIKGLLLKDSLRQFHGCCAIKY